MILDADRVSAWLTELTLLQDKLAQRVQVFDSAESALAFLSRLCFSPNNGHEVCPDLILLEPALAGMDGFQFLQELQEWGHTQLIKDRVVVLTCSISQRDKAQAEAYQVGHFISKPLTSSAFKTVLQGV